jgi:hypothetical protein
LLQFIFEIGRFLLFFKEDFCFSILFKLRRKRIDFLKRFRQIFLKLKHCRRRRRRRDSTTTLIVIFIILLLLFFDEILNFCSSNLDLIDWDCRDLSVCTSHANGRKQPISFQDCSNIRRFRFFSITKKTNLLLRSVVADGENDDEFFCFFGDFSVDDGVRFADWITKISAEQKNSTSSETVISKVCCFVRIKRFKWSEAKHHPRI